MDKSTKVSKDKGSCLNVAQETHEATFTFGLGGNRPGDEALYNALSAEGKLDFDNENVKYAYIDKKICRGGNEPIDSVA